MFHKLFQILIPALTYSFCLQFCALQITLAEPIKIGVPIPLTGDNATLGEDIKNAIILANELFPSTKYQFIFEDDRCDNTTARSIAEKLINYDKVKYALGFGCNSSLIASAPLYEKANILVLSSSGTSGDIPSLGKNNFRIFPADQIGAELLASYSAKKGYQQIAVVTESNQYSVMMERSFLSVLKKSAPQVKIFSEEFIHPATDLHALATRVLTKKPDIVFLNPNTDTAFISLFKRFYTLNPKQKYIAVYLPASATILAEFKERLDGVVFANLPSNTELATPNGELLLNKFNAKFGQPKAGFPVVLTTLEAVRILDLAIDSNQDPINYLTNLKVSDGLMSSYYFDKNGAIQGLNFELQEVRNAKVIKHSGF